MILTHLTTRRKEVKAVEEYNSVTFTTAPEGTEIFIDGLKLKGVVTSEIIANGAEPLARLKLEMDVELEATIKDSSLEP